MGLTTLLGKTLIIASIVFEAYLIYADKQTITAFDKQLTHAMAGCDCFTPDIQKLLKEHLRLVVVGLLGAAVLLFAKCWAFKLPTFLGLSLLLWVEQHEVFRRVPTLAILENTALWHALGVIGVVIYLIGAECNSCENKPAEKKAEPAAEPPKRESKDNKKRN